MLRLLLSAALGLGLMALLIMLMAGDDRYLWLAITAGALVPLLASLIGVSRMGAGVSPVAEKHIRRARDEGRLAGAAVIALQRTGVTINDVPVYEVELLVQPSDREPYRTTVRRRIDPAAMPRFQVGTTLSVVRLGRCTPDVEIVDDPPPPVNVRDPQAVPRWEADPDAKVPGRSRSIVPVGPRGRVARRTAFLAVGVAAAAALGWPYREVLGLRVRSWIERDDLVSALRGDGRAQAMIEQFIAAGGGRRAAEVVVHDTWLAVTAPTAPGASTYDTFEVRGPHLPGGEPAVVQPEPGAEFDLDEIGWEAIPDLFRRGMEELGVTDEQLRGVSQLAIAGRAATAEGPGALQLRVLVQTDYVAAWVSADPDGTFIEVQTS